MKPAQRGPALQSVTSWGTGGVNLNDVAAFLIPSLGFFEIDLIGKLYSAEIFFFLLFCFLAPKRAAILKDKWPSRVILFGVLWLVAQIVSDWVNQTEYVDYARGLSKIAFIIINFSAIYMLINGHERRIFLFGFGAAAGLYLSFVMGSDTFASIQDQWKFGSALPLAMIAGLGGSLFSGTSGKRVLGPAVIFFGIGVFSLLLNFRSFSGICLMVGAFLLVRKLFLGDGQKRSHRGVKAKLVFAVALAFFVMAGAGILRVYSDLAQSGLMGQIAQEKYEDQAAAGGSSLFISARFENIIGISAIREAPFLGRGSWAKDTQDKLGEILDRLNMAGYDFPDYLYNSPYIPLHSHIFAAWVEAGILGAVFWALILFLIGIAISRLLAESSRLDVYVTFLCFNLGWDILFSPMAGNRRFMVAFAIVVLILFVEQSRKYMASSQNQLS